MTVSTTHSKHVYTGNGVTTQWPYTFPIISSSDVKVYLTDLSDVTTEVTTRFSVESGYVLYPQNLEGQSPVISPLASGYKITLLRSIDIDQDIDLKNQGNFNAEVLENAYDKLTMVSQQVNEALSRAVKYPVQESPTADDTETFLTTINAAKADAQTAASNAGTSETNAGLSAAAASSSAGAASGSAVAAAASALSASGSSSLASGFSDAASSSASTASGHASTATTKAGEAAASALSASSSASSASGYASAASGSASTASGHAQTASTKAGEASASALAASGSASTASGHAQTATTKAGEAAQSAIDASGYASAASGSASSASGFASAASGSASTASGHAQTATTKAGEAAQSALDASGYATAASGSASSASGFASAASGSASTASGHAQTATTKAGEAAQSAIDAASYLSTATEHIGKTSGAHGITGSFLGTSDAQVVTNKDIDGGTASNARRITLPKDTLTNITSLTRKEGTVLWDTTNKKMMVDDGSNLKPLGGQYSTQNFTGTTIAATSEGFQRWRYTGSSAQVLAEVTLTSMPDAGIMMILGTSDTNTIQVDDSATGVVMNGPWVGGLGQVLVLMNDTTLGKVYEISRT
jgi:uncharacterized protein YjbJ (UPF0337 family)